MTTPDDQFWVIFDTCARPAYYQDVHNILALPQDYIYRYNYRKSQITTAAWEACGYFHGAPRDVLLVYQEYDGFKRGADMKAYSHRSKKSVATRIATMAHIEIDGENAYFDLRLGRFPAAEVGSLAVILNDLESAKAAPMHAWVATSNHRDALRVLSERGQSEANWDKIAAWFHKGSTQFSQDSFWRFDGPFTGTKNVLMAPQDHRILRDKNGDKKPVRVESFYKVENQQEFWFDLANREPLPADTAQKPAPSQSNISSPHRTVAIDDKSGRVVPLSTNVQLRAYFSQGIRFRVTTDNILQAQDCSVLFSTQPQPDAWPTGPNVSLLFRARLPWWRPILGALAGVVGLTLGFVATKQTTICPGVWYFSSGTLLVLISGYVIYREVRLKV